MAESRQAAYLNRIATAVPPHNIHRPFVDFAANMLDDERTRGLFLRMARTSGIRERFSVIHPDPSLTGTSPLFPPELEGIRLFRRGSFPSTAHRMRLFEQTAPALARAALDNLAVSPEERRSISHVLVTSCTGLYAPGLDFEIVDHLGLSTTVERTVVGFMGCYAAMNALKLARHIVRSEPRSRVLLLNLELCTLHLQETQSLEQVLSFLVFADGAAASLISADPHGLALSSFRAVLIPDTRPLITWNIGALGFDMLLSGQVPNAIARTLRSHSHEITGAPQSSDTLQSSVISTEALPPTSVISTEAQRSGETRFSSTTPQSAVISTDAQPPTPVISTEGAEHRSGETPVLAPAHATHPIDLWAVHPGGRSVLDAIEDSLQLPPDALAHSRNVLERFGNMSSATIMFVLAELLRSAPPPHQRGCAMSFGPGLTAETLLFHTT